MDAAYPPHDCCVGNRGPESQRRSQVDPVLPVATVRYQEFYSPSGSHILANLGHRARRWIAEEYSR